MNINRMCKGSFVVAAFLGCLMSVSWGSWTQPEFVSELNDYQNNFIPSHFNVSGDSNTAVFIRAASSGSYYLWEAQKDIETGLYTRQRIVTELGFQQGRPVWRAWISRDGLRLYYSYCRESSIYNWDNIIEFAARKTINDKWARIRPLSEINLKHTTVWHTLTDDERYIIWMSRECGSNQCPYTIYSAVRDPLTGIFGNIKPVDELNTVQANNPSMSSDGLVVYFTKNNLAGLSEIWKGSRTSRDEPFGNFALFSEANLEGSNQVTPFTSPDGKAFYFTRRVKPGNANIYTDGVYVTYWFETPYEKAVRCLTEARDIKIDVLEGMKTADQKEKEALAALSEMLKTGLPEGLTKKDIQKVRMDILWALCKQVIAEREIKMSLKELEKSITILDPGALD